MNYILSIFIGILISIMILFNGTLSNAIGNYSSSVVIHFVGLILVLLILLFKRERLNFNKSLPLYLYSGGVIGVFTILSNNISFRTLGISLTLALGLLGQSISAVIIDHYGLLGIQATKFNRHKITGLAIIVLGIFMMVIF